MFSEQRLSRVSVRSPLLAALRRIVGVVRASARTGAPPLDEWLDPARRGRSRGITRRRLLRDTTIAGVTLGLPRSLAHAQRVAPRIAIVGAGIAGLNAADTLRKRGFHSTVYEASERIGGRMFSARDLLGPGIVTELGGEFIDSTHRDLLELASELGLERIDVKAESERALAPATFFFAGVHRSERELAEAFAPLAKRIADDLESVGTPSFAAHGFAAWTLDRESLEAYLDRIGASGWVRRALEVAYVTEYGLDAGEQSSLNLISLIGSDADDFALFGASDERYKIRGGNERIPLALAERLADRIQTGWRLAALTSSSTGFTLAFDVTGAGTREIAADLVILALPFTTLRGVELRCELPEWKRAAIEQLGYGTNAKLMTGVARPLWREQGYQGEVFSDQPFQMAWDSSLLQDASAAGLTFFSGGRAGLEVGKGSTQDQLSRLMPGLERAYPGVSAAALGRRASRMHWPTHRYTLGSYACYRPAQWTTLAGAEGLSVGNLFFAGEHCSRDFQGFMNGGAQSGRMTAEAILHRLGAL
jgi:monoamine oxidase